MPIRYTRKVKGVQTGNLMGNGQEKDEDLFRWKQ